MNADPYELGKGAAAGFLATVPMSLFMVLAQRALRPRHQDPLPPRQITERAAEMSGIEEYLDERDKDGLSVLAHFAFGATTGAGYALLPEQTRQAPVLSGMAYGLAVWGASYLGWLPAAGLYRAPTEEPGPRHLMMIGAHLVWGGALGWLLGPRSASE